LGSTTSEVSHDGSPSDFLSARSGSGRSAGPPAPDGPGEPKGWNADPPPSGRRAPAPGPGSPGLPKAPVPPNDPAWSPWPGTPWRPGDAGEPYGSPDLGDRAWNRDPGASDGGVSPQPAGPFPPGGPDAAEGAYGSRKPDGPVAPNAPVPGDLSGDGVPAADAGVNAHDEPGELGESDWPNVPVAGDVVPGDGVPDADAGVNAHDEPGEPGESDWPNVPVAGDVVPGDGVPDADAGVNAHDEPDEPDVPVRSNAGVPAAPGIGGCPAPPYGSGEVPGPVSCERYGGRRDASSPG
jgi:hypothetical protein